MNLIYINYFIFIKKNINYYFWKINIIFKLKKIFNISIFFVYKLMSKYFESRKADEKIYYNYFTKNIYNSYIEHRENYPEFKILGDPHFLKFFNNDYEQYINEELEKRIIPFQRIKNRIQYFPEVEKFEKIIKEKEKLLTKLCEELAKYYKTSKINENFFINYFNKLTNQLKSHAINFHGILPQSIEEILNDIQQKVEIIQSLRFYLNSNLIGRASTYFEQIPFNSKDDTFIIYNYKVINEETFKNANFKLLKELNNRNGKKLRRPIGIGFKSYNYLPIPCRGQCMEMAKITFKNICNYIQSDHNKSYESENIIDPEMESQMDTSLCIECKKYLNEHNLLFDEIKQKLKEEIKIMYYRTCIFCHNINEYIFHPLVYHISKNKIYSDYPIELIKDIYTVNYDQEYLNKNFNNPYEIRKLYHENDVKIELIIKYLNVYNSRNNILDRIMFLPDIKTTNCPFAFLFYQGKSVKNHDYSKCKYFHNSKLERRRNIIITKNEICPESIKTIENTTVWKLNNELNENHKNDCEFFHNRNEVFFDRRNYRKLYICPNEYCDLGELCPYKHPIDIKINEIYLPEKYREELKKKQKSLIDFNHKIMNEVKIIPKCIICNKILGIKFFVCQCGISYCWDCNIYCSEECQYCSSNELNIIDLSKNQNLNVKESNVNKKKKQGNNSMLEYNDINNEFSSDDDINNSMIDNKKKNKKKINVSKQTKNYDLENSMENPSFQDISEIKKKKNGLIYPEQFSMLNQDDDNKDYENEEDDENKEDNENDNDENEENNEEEDEKDEN